MARKRRLSVSIDASLRDEIVASVSRGGARSISVWLSDAIRLKLERDARLHALAHAVEMYEREHGVITEREMAAARRRARVRA